MFKHISTLVLFASATISMHADPTFEIQNKAEHAITIAVVSGGNLVVAPKRLDALTKQERSVLEKNFPQTQQTYLAVWTDNPKNPKVEKNISGKTIFSPTPQGLYKFTTGKTIYLTWDKKDFARPQTGPLFGLKGKTETGYSLKNNVGKSDIKSVAYNAQEGIKLD